MTTNERRKPAPRTAVAGFMAGLCRLAGQWDAHAAYVAELLAELAAKKSGCSIVHLDRPS